MLLGRAPLARGSDRLQALSRLLLVLAFLAAVPLSLLVGVLVHDRVAADAAAQRTARSEVSATLVADAGRATAAPGSYGTSATDGTAATRAVWRTPQGVHQGLVDAPAGSRAGSVVRIWVDGRGEPTVAPMGDGDVAAEAVSAAVLTASVLVGLAALGHLGLVAARPLADAPVGPRVGGDGAAVDEPVVLSPAGCPRPGRAMCGSGAPACPDALSPHSARRRGLSRPRPAGRRRPAGDR